MASFGFSRAFELINLLRTRMYDADAHDPAALHSFKTLMSDHAAELHDGWYWEAFDELYAQGHLDGASAKGARGDASRRLSADGQLYVRSSMHA